MNNNCMLFSKRLNQALDMRDYPPFGRGRVNYVKEIFNLSRSGANKWLHGKAMPHPKARIEIASKLGINQNWLETGQGDPTTPDTNLFKADTLAHEIPLLSLSQAYNMQSIPQLLENTCLIEKTIVNSSISASCFSVKLVGKAMIPKFEDGCILIIDPAEPIQDGDYVIAKSSVLPEALFRQIIFGSDGKYLVALNPKFQPSKLNSNDDILGKVIETRSEL